jgi:hypothetical protein
VPAAGQVSAGFTDVAALWPRTGSPSNPSYAAVDGRFTTRHETAVVRGEEERYRGNLVRPAHTSEGCFGDQGFDRRVFFPNRREARFEALYAGRRRRARGERVQRIPVPLRSSAQLRARLRIAALLAL